MGISLGGGITFGQHAAIPHTTGMLADGAVTNIKVNAAAAIAKTKLAALDIVDADVNAAAAIAKTKLAALDIVNADVNAAAAIAQSKIAQTAAWSLVTIPDIFGKWELLASGSPAAAANWDSGAFAAHDLIIVQFQLTGTHANAAGIQLTLNGLAGNNYWSLYRTGIAWTLAGPTANMSIAQVVLAGPTDLTGIGWILISGRNNTTVTPVKIMANADASAWNGCAGHYNGALIVTSIQLLMSNGTFTGDIKVYGVDF
jgi:hypothetical protein